MTVCRGDRHLEEGAEQRLSNARAVIANIGETYDGLIGDGLSYHEPPSLRSKRRGRPKRRPGHDLVIQMRDHEPEILKFLRRPEIPHANDLAERGVRPLKIRRKISGSFRLRCPQNRHKTAKRQR